MNKLGLIRALLASFLCVCISFSGGAVLADTDLISNGDFEVVTDGSGLELGVAVYTDGDGEILTQMPSGGVVNSSVSMKNVSDGEKTISVVCALYNSENTMMDVSATIISPLKKNKKATAENTLNIPSNADDTWSIKTYVLENLGDMYSYCESFSYPAEPAIESKWNMEKGFSLSSEDVYDGYSSLKICGPSSQMSQAAYINKNSMYKMSFMGKGDSDFNYGIYNTSDEQIADEKTFEPSDDWSINSLLFKSSDENAILKFKNNGNGKAFIDNVVLSDDILINGDFEDSEFGWVLDDTCFEVDKTNPYEGKRSLKITSNSAGARAYQETEVIAHSKGMIYFKSKCSEEIYLKVFDAESNEIISKVGTTIPSSSSWKDNYVYVNTLGYDKLRICFETKTSNAKISYIDNVKFTNLVYSDELVNSDFESGLDGWVNERCTYDNSSAEMFSGEMSGHLADRTATYSALSQDITDILNKYGPGSYYVEGYVKPGVDLTNYGGWLVIRVRYTPKGAANHTQKTITVASPKNEWTKISGVVDLTWDDAITTANIRFETSWKVENTMEYLCDLFIDDVSFFKMPD